VGTITLGAWFAACGIDENGTMPSVDGSVADQDLDVVYADLGVKEVNPEANPPVLTCLEAGTPLDASCLGNTVPTGWQPIAIQAGVTVGCGDAGFTATPLVTDPQVPTGACNCTGCTATGTWSCSATLAAGSTCTAETNTPNGSSCWAVSHNSYGMTLTRNGNPTCDGGQQIGNQDASSTAISTCTPTSCESDFCGLGNQGFKLCIWNPNVTDGGCPSQFPAGRVVGTKADVACAVCQQCGLANANAQCTASLTAYQNSDCSGNVEGTTTSQTCQNSAGFQGLYYDAGPVPSPNCGAPTGPQTGKATLEQPSTICCAN
jgi:hypothetical protein